MAKFLILIFALAPEPGRAIFRSSSMAEHSAVNRRVVSSSLTCGANSIHSLRAPIGCLFLFAHKPVASSFGHPRSIGYRTAGQPCVQARKGSSGGLCLFHRLWNVPHFGRTCSMFNCSGSFNPFRVFKLFNVFNRVQACSRRIALGLRRSAVPFVPCPQGFVARGQAWTRITL